VCQQPTHRLYRINIPGAKNLIQIYDGMTNIAVYCTDTSMNPTDSLNRNKFFQRLFCSDNEDKIDALYNSHITAHIRIVPKIPVNMEPIKQPINLGYTHS